MKLILICSSVLFALPLVGCGSSKNGASAPSETTSDSRVTAGSKYTPASCEEAGGEAKPSPGGVLTEADCASGKSLGVIDAGASGWIEGGLCCAKVETPAAGEATGKACGARAGNTCTDKEFCAYKAGSYCGAADAQATCMPRPEMCNEIYKPVCGCDDKTYGNECEANRAGVGFHTEGECPKSK